MHRLIEFQNKQVRDLVWVIAAPNLLEEADWLVSDSECTALLALAMTKLLALDQCPDTLHKWIAARKPFHLGPYVETLVAYWLTYLIDTTWFATNQIVQSGRTTVGEYDMLWRASSGLLNHWEVSAKLYLQVDAAAGFAGYIGTMTKDRLDLKVARLRDKQLRLAQTVAGAAVLPYAGEPVNAKALLKGCLFYPPNSQISRALGVSSKHTSGWWQRWGTNQFDLIPNLRWCVLERLAWLTPVLRADAATLQTEMDFRAWLMNYFERNAEPLLVAGLALDANGWGEITRGFVVPQAWI